MSRIAPLDPPYPADVQASFDAIMPPGAPPLVLFRVLATSERAWRKFRAGSLLDKGPLSLRQRELVIDRVCARTGCEYEWGVHIAIFADAAKLTRAEVAATIAPLDPARWSAEEATLLAAVDALHDNNRWTDAEHAALATHYDADQILEIILLCGFYRTVSYICGGLDLPLEPSAARFPAKREVGREPILQ